MTMEQRIPQAAELPAPAAEFREAPGGRLAARLTVARSVASDFDRKAASSPPDYRAWANLLHYALAGLVGALDGFSVTDQWAALLPAEVAQLLADAIEDAMVFRYDRIQDCPDCEVRDDSTETACASHRDDLTLHDRYAALARLLPYPMQPPTGQGAQ